jgi:intermediate peptidase
VQKGASASRAAGRRSASRLASTAAAQLDRASSSPASFSAPDTAHDDKTLRRIFDDQRFWQDFRTQASQAVRGQRAGLFQNKYLTSPEGFERYTHATLRKCKALVRKILAAETTAELVPMARDFDRLSDLLCRVIDLSDFVRATHPRRDFQLAATGAYNTMFEFMNQLNTTTALNDQLKRASATKDVTEHWTEEEKTVAFILERDFSKSAIELPEEDRHDFVELSSRIADVGTEFVDGMQPEQPYLKFDSGDLKGMDSGLIKNLTSWGKVTMPTVGTAAVMALRTAEDDDVRRAVYMANRTASRDGIKRLETLLASRSKLAEVCGYKSYAHMALSDKMAKTPEAVDMFLQALLQDTRPQVQEELQDLLELKKSDAHSTGLGATAITAWDRDYYTTRLLSNMQSRIRPTDTLSSFFSLGSVFQGLSRLFHRLYGIRLVPREVAPGETWNEDVRRIDVIDDTAGHIAVMYCDLFSRPGKSPNPAHFTLRCSREILPGEVAEFADTLEPFASPVEAATDGMAHSLDAETNTVYQLPTIALICDFAIPARVTRQSKPALLSFREVQTLFHEMGHALHSMLGRTALQNVSGTRCATDFAELPSVLMEQFAFDPQVLGLWARHWQDDRALPYELVSQRLEIEKRMAGAETEAQILLAFLDQEYHARPSSLTTSTSTDIYHSVWDKYSSVPEPHGTAWQGFFGHLFGYGATYYSYLFDRAIAGRVWSVVFRDGEDSLDRGAGERYKEEVLRWGGARDGWACVAGVLEDGKLVAGGVEAMKEVGRWGVRDAKR